MEWGVPARRIFFGNSVVDNEFFSSRSAHYRLNLKATRLRQGLPVPFLLNIARQIPIKNLLTLLEAYRRYRESKPEVLLDLVLVGNGPERGALESFVNTRQVPGVHFRPFASQDGLCEYYAIAKGFVLPSLSETWGLVVNEAMACGLPVLVSKECGCAETLVKEGANGWTFEARNIPELADRIKKLADLSPVEHENFGRRSSELVSEWPVDRFASGLWDAIRGSAEAPLGRSAIFLDTILIHLWRGRYNPV
jgi:glycosyltransferase involved in cell wall biosynthesis